MSLVYDVTRSKEGHQLFDDLFAREIQDSEHKLEIRASQETLAFDLRESPGYEFTLDAESGDLFFVDHDSESYTRTPAGSGTRGLSWAIVVNATMAKPRYIVDSTRR